MVRPTASKDRAPLNKRRNDDRPKPSAGNQLKRHRDPQDQGRPTTTTKKRRPSDPTEAEAFAYFESCLQAARKIQADSGTRWTLRAAANLATHLSPAPQTFYEEVRLVEVERLMTLASLLSAAFVAEADTVRNLLAEYRAERPPAP